MGPRYPPRSPWPRPAQRPHPILAHGTLVLAVLVKHGSYMAADSRIASRKSDDAQKIFQCGTHALVGLAGLLLVSRPERDGPRFDMMDALKRACLNYDARNGSVPDHIAGAAWNDLKNFWDAFIGWDFPSFAAAYPNRTNFCEIPIVTYNRDRPALYEIRFPYSGRGDLLPWAITTYPTDPLPTIRTWGRSINTERGRTALVAIRSRKRILNTIEEIYREAGAAHPNAIGGPVDVGFTCPHDGSQRLAGKWV